MAAVVPLGLRRPSHVYLAERRVASLRHPSAAEPQAAKLQACTSCSAQAGGRQGTVYFSGGAGSLSFAAPPEPSGLQAAPPPVSWWMRWQSRARSLQRRLKAYGMAGLVSYGICNTLYYTCAFIFIWCYIVQVPRGLGYAEAGKKFVEVMGMTWAYSQVTKVGRAGAAVALAPFVDACLLMIQCRLGLRNRQAAFYLMVSLCCAVTAIVFGGVIALWS